MSDMSIIGIVSGIIGAIVLITTFASALFTVKQQTKAVIERFGKFHRIVSPGLGIKVPFIDRIAGRPSLRIKQLDVKVETKTKDNVFVHIKVSLMYQIIDSKVETAFYKLTNFDAQVNSYIFDDVRAQVPVLNLDDVFAKKEEIADSIRKNLSEIMDDFGYAIIKALVTDIDPDAQVKESMNEINAAQRQRVAAQEKGEADKILLVKKAEAEAESKRLQGQGIANQRKAIIEGLQKSVEEFKGAIPEATADDVMKLVLLTQYMDTLKEMGTSANTHTIFLTHSPDALQQLQQQLSSAYTTGSAKPTGSEAAGEKAAA